MASNSAGIGGLLPPQTTDVANYILTTDGQTASWEVSSASLPSQGGNSGLFLTTDGSVASWAAPLPDQTSNNGKFLTTDGSAASWGDASGLTLGNFGSTPAAKGASLTAGTLALQPADGTNPGSVTAAAQTFGGIKTFSAGVATGAAGATHGFLGVASGFPCLWLGTPADSPTTANYAVGVATNTYVNAPTGGDIIFSVNNGAYATIGHTSGNIVLAGHGSGISFISPDGNTTKVLTIDNAGAPVWT